MTCDKGLRGQEDETSMDQVWDIELHWFEWKYIKMILRGKKGREETECILATEMWRLISSGYWNHLTLHILSYPLSFCSSAWGLCGGCGLSGSCWLLPAITYIRMFNYHLLEIFEVCSFVFVTRPWPKHLGTIMGTAYPAYWACIFHSSGTRKKINNPVSENPRQLGYGLNIFTPTLKGELKKVLWYYIILSWGSGAKGRWIFSTKAICA